MLLEALTKIFIFSSSISNSLISGSCIIPKGIASKSPKLLVIVRPGYFLSLNHTRRGPTFNQSILSITPPFFSILILSSFMHGVWHIFNSFIFFSSVINILFVFPKFTEIILFIFLVLNIIKKLRDEPLSSQFLFSSYFSCKTLSISLNNSYIFIKLFLLNISYVSFIFSLFFSIINFILWILKELFDSQ